MSATDIIFAPVGWIAWILSLPVEIFSFIVKKVRKPYDPEREVCYACGFKGDAGTDRKSCVIWFDDSVQGGPALRHDCFRCGARHWTKLFVPAGKWYRSPLPSPPEGEK
jgi:hypothetical protein